MESSRLGRMVNNLKGWERRLYRVSFRSRFLHRHAGTLAVSLPLLILALSVVKIGAEPRTAHSVQTRVYSTMVPSLSPVVQEWLASVTQKGREFGALNQEWREYKQTLNLTATTYNHDARSVEKLLEAGKGWSLAPEVGYGIIRRLDDASFWTLIGVVIAFTAILVSARAVAPTARAAPLGVMRLAVVSAILLVAVYVHRMAVTKGTFFWLLNDFNDYGANPRRSVRLYVVALEQMAEGAVYVLMCLLLAFGVVIGWRIAHRVSGLYTSNPSAAAGIAGPLLSSCVSPFAMLFVVFTVYKVIGAEAGFVSEPGLWFAVNVLGQFALAATPLMFLAALAIIQWRGKFLYALEIGKGLIRVVASPR